MQIAIHLVRREPLASNGATSFSEITEPNQNQIRRNRNPQLLVNNHLNSSATSTESSTSLPQFDYYPNMSPTQTQARSAGKSPSFDERLLAFVPDYDRNAFKIAFYTVVMLAFSGVCLVGFWCVYHLLYAFLKPMLWSILAGTVLFPVKQSVTNVCRGWLRGLRSSSTPLVIGVVCLPISWLDVIAEVIWGVVTSKQLFYVLGGYVLIKLMLYEALFLSLIALSSCAYSKFDSFLLLFDLSWLVPIGTVYFCAFFGWLYLQPDDRPVNKKFARLLSLPIWFSFLVSFSLCLGPFRVVAFIVSSVIIGLLAAGLIAPGSADGENDPETSMIIPAPDDGNIYLKGVTGGCALLFSATHDWVIVLLVLLLIYTIFRKFVGQLSIQDRLAGFFCPSEDSEDTAEGSSSNQPKTVCQRVTALYDTAVPHTLRDCVKLVFSGDQKLVASLESAIDLVSSVAVIVLLVFSMVFGAIFVVFQLHGELVHVVKLSSNVFTEMKSSSSTWMSAAANYTSERLGEDTDVDAYVEQAYVQGRTWLATQVRQLADAKDTERADLLETQVKNLVDGLYEMWQKRDAEQHKLHYQQTGVWAHLSQAHDLEALKQEFTAIVKENVGTLMHVAESIWSVLSANLAVIISLLSGVVGLLLTFGMELLNFIIQLIVFFTMLYYLLASSGDVFMPMELLGHLSMRGTSADARTPENSVTSAVEQSINGVFLLTAKMTAFYGMYTWFLHCLFDLNVVFVPTALACVFAAIPLTAPSWVCILGVAELALVRAHPIAALLFFISSLAPMMTVDAAFYNEVKGSHPYMTGLAVVGGMYWLGLEGAIMGPIILCCVLALVNVYTTIL